MADDINLRVPLKENVSYFGLGLLLAYRKHGRLFPSQPEIGNSYKHYGIRAIAWFCATILTLLALALVTK
ncbi:MAG: hypothetical protein WA020_09675 [Candidatus Acidiferrales bacterium]